MDIPLIVHQIWMNKEETEVITRPPADIRALMTSWTRSCYKYILWNQVTMRRYIEEVEPEFLKIYDALPLWIERCDTFRYFVLYHMGGVYVDADTNRTGTLEPVVKNRQVVIVTNSKELSNHFMASVAGHPFMRDLYLNVSTRGGLVYKTTGPYYVNSRLKRYPQRHHISVVLEDTIPVIHHSAKSWVGDQAWSIYDYLLTPVLVLVTILLVIILGLLYRFW